MNLQYEVLSPREFRHVKKAYVFARDAHEGQLRRYSEGEYINHPVAVATMVFRRTKDVASTRAALLHDVVEDTDTTIEDIRAAFGDEVARLVDGLTDVSKPEDGNRAQRKKIDLDHLAKGCAKIHTIKLADLINNSESIMRHDPDFSKVFFIEMANLLEVLVLGDLELRKIAENIVSIYESGK